MIDLNNLKTPQYPDLDEDAERDFQIAHEMAQPRGKPIDFAEVARLYQRAADKGHYKAMNNLAVLYLQGQGVEESEEKAVALYKQMQQYQIPEAHRAMAYVYEKGLGNIRKSKEKAKAELYKAAEYGDLIAINAIGLSKMYEGTPEKRKEAIILFEYALGKESVIEAGTLAQAYLFEERHKDYYDALIRGANLGARNSLSELSTLFRLGEYGFPVDKERGKCFSAHALKASKIHGYRPANDIRKLCPANKPLPYDIKE